MLKLLILRGHDDGTYDGNRRNWRTQEDQLSLSGERETVYCVDASPEEKSYVYRNTDMRKPERNGSR